MSGIKIGAVVLIIAGVVGLAYGRLSISKEVHSASVGPVSLTARESQEVVIPMWAAIGAIVAGGLVLMTSKRGMRT